MFFNRSYLIHSDLFGGRVLLGKVDADGREEDVAHDDDWSKPSAKK
jgi:hypothetical protein